ncbi:hypothetical protein F0562_017837 [Nyssa sinensis]|uniref:Uncharacterized protein n=1 Tax=Nyssa sinensis TaxID=561372 RepID=A0A5J4ZFU5_9ASTE|nr:hypothetical protein F0562_017837 [Nyssa sinensis]
MFASASNRLPPPLRASTSALLPASLANVVSAFPTRSALPPTAPRCSEVEGKVGYAVGSIYSMNKDGRGAIMELFLVSRLWISVS